MILWYNETAPYSVYVTVRLCAWVMCMMYIFKLCIAYIDTMLEQKHLFNLKVIFVFSLSYVLTEEGNCTISYTYSWQQLDQGCKQNKNLLTVKLFLNNTVHTTDWLCLFFNQTRRFINRSGETLYGKDSYIEEKAVYINIIYDKTVQWKTWKQSCIISVDVWRYFEPNHGYRNSPLYWKKRKFLYKLTVGLALVAHTRVSILDPASNHSLTSLKTTTFFDNR